MSKSIYQLLLLSLLSCAACTSRQKSPVDSHPESGSVKAGRSSKEQKPVDTAKDDSALKNNGQ